MFIGVRFDNSLLEKNSTNNVQRVFVFLGLVHSNETYNKFFPNLN